MICHRFWAKKFNFNQTTLGRYLKVNDIEYLQKENAPFVPEKQLHKK